MDTLSFVLDLIVHINVHVRHFAAVHGAWVYALLFLVIFVETGFVITPFIPGDSLLFVVGALCAVGVMSLAAVITLLTAAAVAGNQCNYAIGHYFGPKVFRWENSQYFNRHAFDTTHAFYEKYGGVMIVAARFIPLLRSFAPFVAGVAQMPRARFAFFDVLGGALWVTSLSVAGYLFGNAPWIQDHLDKAIFALLGATVLLGLASTVRGRIAARRRRGA